MKSNSALDETTSRAVHARYQNKKRRRLKLGRLARPTTPHTPVAPKRITTFFRFSQQQDQKGPPAHFAPLETEGGHSDTRRDFCRGTGGVQGPRGQLNSAGVLCGRRLQSSS